MKQFNQYRQTLLFAAAVLAAIAVIAVILAGCIKKNTAPTAGTGDAAANYGCGAADILFGAADSAGALSLTFTDSRDCQKYRAVKIGRDVWMARNLNYKTANSTCFENDDAGCDKFGRYYDWNEAQTACPAGWHLPSAEEWDNLLAAAGGEKDRIQGGRKGANKKLQAKSGWDLEKGNNEIYLGTDDYGFSALPGGRCENGKFLETGIRSFWWTSKEEDGRSAYVIEMLGNAMGMLLENSSFINITFKEERLPVRCVNDDGVIVKAGERGSFSLTLKTGDGGTLSATQRKDSYVAGEKVKLTATPKTGYAFAGWTGGRAADSASLVTVITVLSDTTVAAKFRRIEYGSLTDERDGKTYRTVKIGRRTWMAENLNYKPADGGSSCLDGNCKKYGRLYDWNTAQEACPAGWLLPSFDNWEALAVYAGGANIAGKKLKAASGWVGDGGYRGNGTDYYGFSALPGGGKPKRLENQNTFGAWWTATTMYSGAVNARFTLHKDDFSGLAAQKSNMYSVRCVLDEGGALTLTAGSGGTVSGVPSKTSFKAGETATITALPKSGYVFSRWTGGKVADSTAAVTTVAMRSDMNITAHFRAAPGVSGTLADKRDGQKYKTTQIGNQVWTAQNLNYKTGNSWCYNDSDSYCKKYGRLYDWSTAKTACPAGWHLPSRSDWYILATTATGNNIRAYYDEYNDDDKDGVGKVLKAKTGWNQYDGDRKGNGTDEYGFAALPGGRHRTDADDDDDYSGETPYEDAGDVGTWWTATETDDEGNAYFMYISKYADDLVGNPYLDYKNYGFSVRCVMDGGVNKQASTQKTKRSSPTGGKPEIETVFVKGGTFKMGCTDDEKNCPDKYHQAHNVTLGDFHICKYEVTQKQWTQVMGDNPSGGVLGDDYPVNNISWYDIQEFIERLNAVTGKKYRLPTEAEWEYAARGGANGKGYKYSGSDNPDDVAWNIENSGGEPHPVGLNAPNELGLYDMTGNVWEFTGDWHGDYGADDRVNPTGPREGAARTARGCSWSEKPCRVYDRGYSIPGESSTDAGFRLVLLP